jgi:predicted secreted hydrolase
MNFRIVVGLLLVLAVAAAVFVVLRPAQATEVRSSLVATTGEPPSMEGFARATEPGALAFPDAFGAHPEYQTEWWYYTGNVQTEAGRRFGYQFTIFRRSLAPPQEEERPSEFAASSVYMAHFTVTDAAGGDFYDNERFQRGGGGVAGAQAEPYQVWLDDWSVVEVEPGVYHMQATADEVAIDFSLRSLKPPALHGNNGLSQKSDEPGNASYYYSQTRLETTGAVTVHGQSYQVSGLSWKDHEYVTSALAGSAVGL